MLAAAVLVVLAHLMPGDPLAAILGERPTDAATVEILRERYGVDRTPLQSLGDLANGALHGDLGLSLSAGRPVTDVIVERLGPTVLLGALTLLVDFTLGLAIGVWCALRPETMRSRLIGAASIAGYALPGFAVGMVLVWLFAVTLGWLPPGGFSNPLLDPNASHMSVLLDRAEHLVLPLATLVIATLPVTIRQQRSAALATVNEPWVQAARARGVGAWAIAWRHCWRPALAPIVTLFGLWLPMLVSGAVFVESVFAWPGIGSLIAEATMNRDVPLVIGAGILFVVVVQLGALVADTLHRFVDPAQRAS